jgi:REP element-mobilizing transposase RayT
MELPNRKPTRLKNYNYGAEGAYFITIRTHNRRNILSNIVGEGLCALPTIKLTPIVEIVENSIKYINSIYNNTTIEKYVIMPNHIHIIIKIKYNANEFLNRTGGHGDPPLQVYNIIGRFKSFTTHKYGDILWQRSFHDHIVRCEKDYIKICEYIDNNPTKWKEDKFYV